MAVILWSGGMDSTLVLYNLAQQIVRKEITYDCITALSVNHCQIPAGAKLHSVREKIKEEFFKRELNHIIQYIELSITTVGGNIKGKDGLTHPLIWLSQVALYLNDNDSLFFGYHSGDDYWQWKNEAETAIINFLKIMEKNNVKINYPLKNHKKTDIIKELKVKGLYDLCWYCENGTLPENNIPCGACPPCVQHKTALMQIEKGLDKYCYELNSYPDIKPIIDLNSKVPDVCSVEINKINSVSDGSLKLGSHNIVGS